MKLHLILTLQQKPEPGNLNHLISLLENPNNKNFIEIIEEEELLKRLKGDNNNQ